MKGRVLVIAGSDPSGGAGIQADIKTITALGGYASTAITALTVQNTKGVMSIHGVAPEIVGAQIDAVLEDIGADAVKIGMLGECDIVSIIAEKLAPIADETPIVLDPVLAATSGDGLAGGGVARAILDQLAPLCRVITPNLDEARILTGVDVETRDDMIQIGARLCERGAEAALVKGGHLEGRQLADLLTVGKGVHWFEHPRIETTSTHGTGCSLASAVATGLAQDLLLEDAVGRAVRYVQAAIKTAPGFGEGHGPLNHAHTIREQ